MSITRKSTSHPRSTDEHMRLEVLKLLRIDPLHPSRLLSRENSHLEYKQTFNWGSRAKYAKTMAAYSNSEGGFIVFGVKDSPRELTGVNIDRFDTLDAAKVSSYLNGVLSPEIQWSAFRVEVAGVELGVLAISPCVTRPVVCVKTDGEDLREADIYYRYRGKSERIRYPELQQILNERQERERDAWLKHLAQVARIGVENVGVLDLAEGELSGPGGRLLIGSDLLEKVQFIREGHFTERDEIGSPTLRLIGDVQEVAPGALRPIKTVAQPLVIGEREILLAFLCLEKLQAPSEYLKQICRESSGYLPIYYFARSANLDLESIANLVNRETKSEKGLGKRLKGNTIAPIGSIEASTPSATERKRILEKLHNEDFSTLQDHERMRIFEATTHFQPTSPPVQLLNFLAQIVRNGIEKLNSNERSNLRKAIAHLDEVLNREACLSGTSRVT